MEGKLEVKLRGTHTHKHIHTHSAHKGLNLHIGFNNRINVKSYRQIHKKYEKRDNVEDIHLDTHTHTASALASHLCLIRRQ